MKRKERWKGEEKGLISVRELDMVLLPPPTPGIV
jgi:hypothetical protein